MHAYGRETVVVRLGDVHLPSDFVRTEYIPFDRQFGQRFKAFLASLKDRADYYTVLAEQLDNNPLLAIDYLRRTYLLTGKVSLKHRAKEIFRRSGLARRAPNSVERLMAAF